MLNQQKVIVIPKFVLCQCGIHFLPYTASVRSKRFRRNQFAELCKECKCHSCMVNRKLGVKTGAERRPQPGIQAQRPAPAPHARHDRSMARSRSVARPISRILAPLRVAAASNVHWLQGCCRAGIDCFFKHFFELMESSCIPMLVSRYKIRVS